MYFSVDLFHDNDVKFVELRTYLTSCVCWKELSSLHHELQFWDFYLDAQINTVKYLSFCDTMSAFRDDAWPCKQRIGQPNELHVYTYTYTGSTNPPTSSWIIRSVKWRHAWPGCATLAVALNTKKRSACMLSTCIRPQRSNTAQQTQIIQPMLFQCWPASPSLAQHWNSIGWMPRVCCEDCIIFLQICRNTMQSSWWLPYVQKVLCSEKICSKGSMFRRFYIQKVLCSEGSMFRRSYIQKVLCSEGPMFRKKLFKSSYIQKVLWSEGPIFRYIQKVLYSENSLFYVEKTYIFQFQVNCNAR